jgi:hypothetical protein
MTVAVPETVTPSPVPRWCSLRRRRLAAIVPLLACIAALSACDAPTDSSVSYRPIFLPVRLSVSESGVAVSGDRSLVTPVGTFSIGAQYSLARLPSDRVYIIIRNQKTGFDRIYSISGSRDKFSAVVNGTTSISVTRDRVVIDVTAGQIREIRFKREVAAQSARRSYYGARWDEGWRSSPYKPFAPTRWMYDDSSISRWHGVGFSWFMVRLILAIPLALVDSMLSLSFLAAQAALVFLGRTARNVAWGLSLLFWLLVAYVIRAWWLLQVDGAMSQFEASEEYDVDEQADVDE